MSSLWQSLKYHHNTTHEKVEKKFECDFCGKKFINADQLKNHTLRHEGNKKFQCKLCGTAYSLIRDLNFHVRSVHENEYKCEKCSKVFNKKRHLNNHILAIHEVPKLKSEKLIPQSYKIDPRYMKPAVTL